MASPGNVAAIGLNDFNTWILVKLTRKVSESFGNDLNHLGIYFYAENIFCTVMKGRLYVRASAKVRRS